MTSRPIESVAGDIRPGVASNSRAARLVAGLRAAGVIDPKARYYFHGRSEGTDARINTRRRVPRIEANDRSTAVLSPVFDLAVTPGASWVDFCDDWSIAPDVNRVHRWRAARSYRRAARLGEDVVVTVNSPYMAARVSAANPTVVPNGVDERLARIQPEGDSRLRLVMLGSFFDGGTDARLILDVARSTRFDEIVIAGPGSSRSLRAVVASLRADYGSRLTVSEWIDDTHLARLSGARTVALIPHTVSDYALSQDLMQVYRLIGLGIRVMCPRMLWPAHLPIDHAFLVDFGASYSFITDWIESTSMSEIERQDFIQANSWAARALTIQRLLEGIHA